MPTPRKSSGPPARPNPTTWRIKGAAHFYKGKGKHLITVKTEHKAVLDTCANWSARASKATYLDAEANGLLDHGAIQGGAFAPTPSWPR